MTLTPLTMAQAAQAADVQTRAFQTDPLWVDLFPDPAQRARVAALCFRPLYRVSIASGQAFGVGAPLQGVTIWNTPQDRGSLAGVWAGVGFLRALFSPLLWRLPRAVPVFARFEAMHARCVQTPHYYLSTIAVAPQARGKGLASALIRPFLARADAEGVPAYTETVTPANVTLYQHYGFRVMEEYAVPDSGLRLWAFLRPPMPQTP